MSILRIVPTMVVPFLLYLLFVATGAISSTHVAGFAHFTMATGGVVSITTADVVGIAVVICLSLDFAQAPITDRRSVLHLGIDMILGVICLVLFLLVPAFATASFFMLMLAALLEFMIGAGITVIAARRDVSYGNQ